MNKFEDINDNVNESVDDKLDDLIHNYDDLYELLSEILEYGDNLNAPVRREFCNFEINDDELILYDLHSEDVDDEYVYTISSLNNSGKKLYIGSTLKYKVVMAYQFDWHDAEIFILDMQKEINEDGNELTRTDILLNPLNFNLKEIFEVLKFGRPAENQKFLSKCIEELDKDPKKNNPFR